MHEVASMAAAEESTAALLKIMDDIASLRLAAPPPTAADGDRVVSVRSHRQRETRTATIASLPGKPMRERGFLPALFAGGLGLAVLAGPVTCPTCDPVHADGRLDAERIAASISTATTSAAPDRVPGSAPAVSATTLRAWKLPDTIEELADKGPPGAEIAAATVEGEPETPLPPVGDTMLPSKDITSVKPEEPALRGNPVHKQVSINQRRVKARTTATLTAASSAPKLYSPNKYSQVPGWAAKMFETNWQDKAFAYQ
jgi:hypothetical protein